MANTKTWALITVIVVIVLFAVTISRPFHASPNSSHNLQRIVQQRDDVSRQLNLLQVRIYSIYINSIKHDVCSIVETMYRVSLITDHF